MHPALRRARSLKIRSGCVQGEPIASDRKECSQRALYFWIKSDCRWPRQASGFCASLVSAGRAQLRNRVIAPNLRALVGQVARSSVKTRSDATRDGPSISTRPCNQADWDAGKRLPSAYGVGESNRLEEDLVARCLIIGPDICSGPIDARAATPTNATITGVATSQGALTANLRHATWDNEPRFLAQPTAIKLRRNGGAVGAR